MRGIRSKHGLGGVLFLLYVSIMYLRTFLNLSNEIISMVNPSRYISVLYEVLSSCMVLFFIALSCLSIVIGESFLALVIAMILIYGCLLLQYIKVNEGITLSIISIKWKECSFYVRTYNCHSTCLWILLYFWL